MATIGVPIKVLHEAEGHIVTIETTTGNVVVVLTIVFSCTGMIYNYRMWRNVYGMTMSSTPTHPIDNSAMYVRPAFPYREINMQIDRWII